VNPYEEPLRRFFRQLNVVNGLLFHLEYQLENYVSAMRDKFGGIPPTAAEVSVYTALIVEDLTHPLGVFRCPSGMFVTEGEEYLQAASRLISRNSAWAVAQGWERFESFLFDEVAVFLFSQSQKANIKTFCEARCMAKGVYKKSEKLLEYLRGIAPFISLGEKNNFRQLDLHGWFRAVAQVRHAVTHSDEVISLDAYRKATLSGDDLLVRYFPGALEPAGYRLCLTKVTAQEALTIFLSYGFLVFKALSMTNDYEWDILKGDFAKQQSEGIRRPA
jgi:hypothetical protein